MLSKLASFFTGGAVKSIENIATEWIDTKKETAEAQAIMVKTLDPNGLMRRDLSHKVSQLYTIYILVTLSLLVCEFFGFGDYETIAATTTKVTSLFTPITTLFGVIVSASFGVNYANTKQNK